MSLRSGTRVGPYEVLSPLGAGGMGEVYRARDSRLGREVALKILPDEYARDPERLARFGREAQILASLNHPRIAAIHGLEESSGTRCLVLELVPGQTLAERLEAGPVSVREALEIAGQIAEALEAAHDRGIIHRDLKPANIKITPEGAVKVLDFGLAKALEASADPGAAAGAGAAGQGAGTPPPPPSLSPTLTLGATARGVILGTAAYMSPEQARGQAVDRRADVWAFGCVVYEMLTGRRVFDGESISDTLAAVLKSEPDWGALPADTPPRLREILRRCLEKDLRRRRRDIGDVSIEIGLLEASSGTGEGYGPAETAGGANLRRRTGAAWLVAGLAAVGILLVSTGRWRGVRQPMPPPEAQALEISLGEGERLVLGEVHSLALSRDGGTLAYVARKDGVDRIYVRALRGFESRPLPGTEQATSPFFSPDGRSVGFISEGKVRRISVDGGAAQALCDADARDVFGGATWSRSGALYFTDLEAGLKAVSESGKSSQPILLPARDGADAKTAYPLWPQVLDESGLLLFTIGEVARTAESNRIAIASAAQASSVREARVILEASSFARFSSSGYLIFSRRGSLLAAPFDPRRGTIEGEPRLVVEGVAVTGDTGAAQFAVADRGLLAYVPGSGSAQERALVWVDRAGSTAELRAPHRSYVDLNLSPSGDRVVMGIQGREGGSQDLWLIDLKREALTRLTSEPSAEMAPVWSPDEESIYYCTEGEQTSIFRSRVDRTGAPELVWRTDHLLCPSSFSPDGRWLALTSWDVGADIWILSLLPQPTGKAHRETPFRERQPQFSPDGRFLTYVSDESGRSEIYIERLQPPGERVQVSSEGGTEPRWARNGRELFFRDGNRLMAAGITTQPALSVARATVLFEGEYEYGGGVIDYDVSADGSRFLLMEGTSATADPTRIRVLVNWERLLDSAPASPGGV
jgi:Tol biopolymer transport system component